MSPVQAFTIVMAVWVISDFISKKTKALLSVMLVSSLIFLVAFATDFFPSYLIQLSGFQGLGNAIVGLIIVHLGTMMSLDTLKAQWKTFTVGVSVVVIGTFILMFAGQAIFDTNIGIAGAAAAFGGTVSILMVQDFASNAYELGGDLGRLSAAALATLPLLILNLKNMVGFLISSGIIKKEVERVVGEYRKGNLKLEVTKEESQSEDKSMTPQFLQTPYGILAISGLAVVISMEISKLLGGHVNSFVIALLAGIVLRHFKILKPNVLSTTDSFGLMMLSIMVIAFGPLANISPSEILTLVVPISFFIGGALIIIAIISLIVGKQVGFSPALSFAVGLTSFFGFPGTMILTKEASNVVAETEEEVSIVEQEVLPTMITGGFSTITITSVLIGGIIVGFMIM